MAGTMLGWPSRGTAPRTLEDVLAGELEVEGVIRG